MTVRTHHKLITLQFVCLSEFTRYILLSCSAVLLKSEPWLPLLPPIDFSPSAGQAESAAAEENTVDITDEFQVAAEGKTQTVALCT